jgi:hypothetical protein
MSQERAAIELPPLPLIDREVATAGDCDRKPNPLALWGFAQIQLSGCPGIIYMEPRRADRSLTSLRRHLSPCESNEDRLLAYNRHKLCPFLFSESASSSVDGREYVDRTPAEKATLSARVGFERFITLSRNRCP